MTDVEAQIRQFIIERVAPDEGATLPADTDLLSGGYLDSLTMVHLVNHVEATFGIAIDADEFVVDNFRTIERVTSLVSSKLNESKAN